MKKFVLTPLAARDIDDIWDYLAEDSIDTADRVLAAIERTILRLVRHPGIGHLREDLADRRHRFFLIYPYLIVYRKESGLLQVVRVLHAARDIQARLSETPESEE